jgi:hypothetical protein
MLSALLEGLSINAYKSSSLIFVKLNNSLTNKLFAQLLSSSLIKPITSTLLFKSTGSHSVISLFFSSIHNNRLFIDSIDDKSKSCILLLNSSFILL